MPLVERVVDRSNALVTARTKTTIGTNARGLLARMEGTARQGYDAKVRVTFFSFVVVATGAIVFVVVATADIVFAVVDSSVTTEVFQNSKCTFTRALSNSLCFCEIQAYKYRRFATT